MVDESKQTDGSDSTPGSRPAAGRPRLEQWALVAEIVGSIAVVVSVVYLALQIGDNNKLLRSQGHFNALSLMQRPFEMMVENESLARIMFECDSRPEQVSDTDWQRCNNYYLMQINGWEYAYYQNLDGAIPAELWGGADAYFIDQVNTKAGYVRFWAESAIAFDEPFRSYATERIRMNPHFRIAESPR